jgi:hypothetical protein
LQQAVCSSSQASFASHADDVDKDLRILAPLHLAYVRLNLAGFSAMIFCNDFLQ